jgi:hypothetical protein
MFLDWISTADFEKVHDSIYAKKHNGTGNWLIEKEEFRTWFSSSKSSLLWCHGKRKYHARYHMVSKANGKQLELASQCLRKTIYLPSWYII